MDESNMRLLYTEQEVAEAKQRAKEEFLARLEMGGLTVTAEARRKWWGGL